MTVITLARKHTLSTSFGAGRARAICGKSHSIADIAISAAAFTTCIAMISIAVFGVNSSILVFRLSKAESQIASFGEELEALRLQSFPFLKPDTLSERARMLELVESGSVHYVSHGAAEELARK